MMIVWPSLLTPRGIRFTFDARTRSGGVSITGAEQIAASNGGFWRASLIGIPVVSQQKRHAWRALEAQIQGRTNDVLVPVFSIDQPVMIGGIPHSDEALFSDGSGYSQRDISAVFTSGAALRATEITLTVLGATVQPGQYFSVGTGRLHLIASLLEVDGDDITIRIWPPLREPVEEGADADFSAPKCRMKLATDNEMAAEFDLGRFASPTVEFVEYL
ncbi:MAG: hypothetical protein Q8M31_18435 [Beijerinckiaceae bacterium]|nr:hypothetical protein [Beijerinckiaceae bacterium]